MTPSPPSADRYKEGSRNPTTTTTTNDHGRRDNNNDNNQWEDLPENARAQAVFIRPVDEVEAMSWNQRAGKRMKHLFGGGRKRTEPAGDGDGAAISSSGRGGGADDEEQEATFRPVQYRLEATRVPPKQKWYCRILTCCGLLGGQRQTGLTVGINPNQRLAMYLHWMFRVNFIFLFAVMCTMFFALVILFAGFIAIAGAIDPNCVRIGGEPFGSANTQFADAFALSWTTFSTVGYGSTYPALGYQNDSPTNCFFINFICSLESLLGVLYSGFCGAILFGKVLRIQSQAQVIFSDPILIRYGSGLLDENASEEDPQSKSPCPVLEFRIVNRLYNEPGGEIMDATLNVVANIDADDADPTLRHALDGVGSTAFPDSVGTDSASESGSIQESIRSENSNLKQSILRLVTPFTASMKRDHQAVEEDPSARLVSKHIFSKMLIEASDHPFFKRVWLARHCLDESSPLLLPRTRRQIRRNGGAWPERLNNHNAIRESLRFNQILVSLNGVSNVSASDVYAQKIYDFVDVNIGYQFVNILYRDGDGQLGVDTDLINDVREQAGGGGEPLILED